MTVSIEDRFWSKVDRRGPDECWLWIAPGRSHGYGCFWSKGRNVKAHRFAYELTFGEIATGQHVLHRCDNPPCVNPAHLFLGANHDNVLDAVRKGRHRSPTVRHGEQIPSSKLVTASIIEIRSRAAAGEAHRAIASDFSVTRAAVSQIVSRQRWAHVQ